MQHKTKGSEELRRLLTPPAMSQAEVARKLGVTPQSVSGWVQGRCKPDPARMAQLEELLGIPMRAWVESQPEAATHVG